MKIQAFLLTLRDDLAAVKSEEFRYTLYSNDAEELYDHRKDRHEWKNLAKDQKYKQVKSEMKRKLFELLGDNPDEKRGIATKSL